MAKNKLTAIESEVIRLMQRKKDFVRDSDVRYISTAGLSSLVKRLAKKGCRFKARTYKSIRGTATEYKLAFLPSELELKEWRGRRKRSVKGFTECKLKETCFYNVSAGCLVCNYLEIVGHSRGCHPSECKEKGIYKPKGRKQKNVVDLKLEGSF